MLLWQFMLDEAKKAKIDRDKAQALAWVRQRWFHGVRDGQETYFIDYFDWETEWETWKRNFAALQRLAELRERGPSRPWDLIMPDIQAVVDPILDSTRNGLLSDSLSECLDRGIRLLLTNKKKEFATYNATGGFDDLTTLWQAIFVSFFQPSALTVRSVCRDCGNALPSTKSGKFSRAERCPRCKVGHWRHKNPERARKYVRDYKRRERAELKKIHTQERDHGR